MEMYEDDFENDVDEYLEKISKKSLEALTHGTLARYKNRNVLFGRKVFIQTGDQEFPLYILFPSGAGTHPPLISLESSKQFLIWPHVERDGVLCLLSEHDAILIDNPIEVLSFLLKEAQQLVIRCLSGNIREDFESEANTYWSHNDQGEFKSVFCLLDPETCTSSFIFFWAGYNFLIFGDDQSKLKSWIKKFLSLDDEIQLAQTIHLRLERAPIPSEYPRTGSNLFRLISHNDLDMASNLERVLPENIEHFPALISAPTNQGQFVGAVIAESTNSTKRRDHGNAMKGFRKGNVPQKVIRQSIFNQRKTILKTVHLVTRDWVHGRYKDPSINNLNDVTVVVVGCGSLGGFVANTLAMSGINKLVLIDKDLLNSANLSRHILNSKYLLHCKAASLKEYLNIKLPHIESIAPISKSIEALNSEELDLVLGSNLIVSLMGSTSSELFLNQLLKNSPSAPPALYGWMEPYATAHHALHIKPEGACFKCGLDKFGEPIFKATSTTNEFSLPTEPACGTSFMPYGSVSVQNAATLVSEFALDILTGQEITSNHRVRLESDNTLTKNHVQKSGEWTKSVSSGKVTYLERTWDKNNSCNLNHE